MSSNLVSKIIEDIYIIIEDSFGTNFDRELFGMLFDQAGDPSKIFSSIPTSIQRIRSSYLPADLFSSNVAALGAAEALLGNMGVASEIFSGNISNSQAPKESNENAFMRMLGMPMSDAEELQSGELSILDHTTGELEQSETTTLYAVETRILDERSKPFGTREVAVSSNSFSFSGVKVTPLTQEELDAALDDEGSGVQSAEEQLDSLGGDASAAIEAAAGGVALYTASLLDIDQPSGFFKFSYLLIPPIQDARISKCINEPGKIVAKPFSTTMGRTVNQQRTKQSFLESVIRIRLDRATGTQWSSPAESLKENKTIDFGLGDDDDENKVRYSDVVNEWGIIESLIITRLDIMLQIMADDISEKIHHIMESQAEGLMHIERDRELNPDTPSENNTPGADDSCAAAENDRSILQRPELSLLFQAKTIEDALLLFFGGENSASLDLQSETQRNSGLRDGHLMSPLMSIIRSISTGIDNRIDEITEDRCDEIPATQRAVSDANTTIGMTTGVGPIDIAVFTLALFTLDEEALLGLLTNEQYENFMNIEMSYISENDGNAEKQDMRESLNALSEQIRDSYFLFLNYLSQEL